MTNLEVTNRTQYNALFIFMQMSVLDSIVVAYYHNNIILYTFIILWIITCAPALYLHWQYIKYCKNYRIELYDNKIKVSKDGKQFEKSYSEIKETILYKSANLTIGNLVYNAWEAYHVAKIVFNDDSFILIPNILSRDLETDLKKYLPDYKKVYIIWASLSKYNN